MSLIANSKQGNCSRCDAKNTKVRKRGKDLVCLYCCRVEDVEKQTEKKKQKDKVQRALSSLKNTDANRDMVRDKTEMDKWFDYVGTVIKANPYCWNCGAWIPDMITKDGKLVPTDRFYRAASAHIFPKALFPSVSKHPLNFLIISAGCGCHSDFDSSIDKAYEMPVWKIAVERFKTFESQITETHKYLDLFKSKINQP